MSVATWSPAAARPHGDRGQTLVEFALAFPILLVFFLGVLEIGWMCFNQTANLNASRQAARAGSTGSSNSEIEDVARRNSYGLPLDHVVVEVTTVGGSALSNDNRTSGNQIKVETVLLYKPLGALFNFLPQAKVTELRASTTFLID